MKKNRLKIISSVLLSSCLSLSGCGKTGGVSLSNIDNHDNEFEDMINQDYNTTYYDETFYSSQIDSLISSVESGRLKPKKVDIIVERYSNGNDLVDFVYALELPDKKFALFKEEECLNHITNVDNLNFDFQLASTIMPSYVDDPTMLTFYKYNDNYFNCSSKDLVEGNYYYGCDVALLDENGSLEDTVLFSDAWESRRNNSYTKKR